MVFSYLFTHLDFAGLSKLISPEFFKVISPSVLLKIASQLKKNYSNLPVWESLKKNTLSSIEKKQLKPSHSPGQFALQLFFFQILTQDTWILDFRAESFLSNQKGVTSWDPKPLYYKVSPEFLQGIRELYRGFYCEDDVLFEHALTHLGLMGAKDCLKNHFGQGDQTQVEFKLKKFQTTFTEVFSVCKREGLELQPEFFVLGLMLLTLYQNLESEGELQNARKCFIEALEKTP